MERKWNWKKERKTETKDSLNPKNGKEGNVRNVTIRRL